MEELKKIAHQLDQAIEGATYTKNGRKKRMTVVKLSEISGVGRTTIYHILDGGGGYNILQLVKLGQVLGFEVSLTVKIC